MLLQDDLIKDWVGQPALRNHIVSWRWFKAAFQTAVQQAGMRHGAQAKVDEKLLCHAFFDWVRDVDTHSRFEAIDPLDFQHVMAGLLLQHVLAAQLHPGESARLVSVRDDGTCAFGQELPARLITGSVLSLLQALRLQAGHPPLTLDTALSQYWNSFIENATQQPETAICYLDRMTGLEPVWAIPTLIDERPAMHAATATSNSV